MKQFTRPIDLLLPRLTGVRQIKSDSWLARCPAHEDTHPSLSIRETSDHTLLLKCWTGCKPAEIVRSIGLEMADLFPRQLTEDYVHPLKPMAPTSDWREKERYVLHHLHDLDHELRIVQLGCAQLAIGCTMNGADLDVLADAALNITNFINKVLDNG